MSAYAKTLREETNSWASAFLQFETGRGREGYRAYAFIEDEDDKSIYQIALTNYDHICYLGCGGKSGVISVFKKLQETNETKGNLFFVDRDTEREPYQYPEVLRTEAYSWESYVCEPSYVGWVLQRKLSPNLTVAERSLVETGWSNTLVNFQPVFAQHTALCRTAVTLDESLGMSRVQPWADYVELPGEISPGPSANDWFAGKVALAVSKGAVASRIDLRVRYFSSQDPRIASKGKLVFNTLRKFVECVTKSLNRTAVVSLNSARTWMDFMPPSNPSLEFIRTYAAARIGPP